MHWKPRVEDKGEFLEFMVTDLMTQKWHADASVTPILVLAAQAQVVNRNWSFPSVLWAEVLYILLLYMPWKLLGPSLEKGMNTFVCYSGAIYIWKTNQNHRGLCTCFWCLNLSEPFCVSIIRGKTRWRLDLRWDIH